MSETACFHKPTEQNMEKAPQVQAFYTAGKTEAQIRGRSQMIGTHTHTQKSLVSQVDVKTNPHTSKKNKSSNIHYFPCFLF